jgi:hypothetical protein
MNKRKTRDVSLKSVQNRRRLCQSIPVHTLLFFRQCLNHVKAQNRMVKYLLTSCLYGRYIRINFVHLYYFFSLLSRPIWLNSLCPLLLYAYLFLKKFRIDVQNCEYEFLVVFLIQFITCIRLGTKSYTGIQMYSSLRFNGLHLRTFHISSPFFNYPKHEQRKGRIARRGQP